MDLALSTKLYRIVIIRQRDGKEVLDFTDVRILYLDKRIVKFSKDYDEYIYIGEYDIIISENQEHIWT